MDKCPLCDNREAQIISQHPLNMIYQVNCKTCGSYSVTDNASNALSNNFRKECPKISALIKEQNIKGLPPITLINRKNDQMNNPRRITLDDALNRFPDKFSDRVDKALVNLGKLSNDTGKEIKIIPELDYPILYADSRVMESIEFMIQSLSDMGFVKKDSTFDGHNLMLTPSGWDRIYELEKKSNKDSNQVFVAMWFDESMDSAWENGFKKAIEESNYKPIRIDNVEHNNKICDEIIAEIRKSKFIVCDFTGQRGGVYFEAGFGLGLGIPVIWTCREDYVDQLHFDTRQYSHIIWKDEDDLCKRLRNRILATIV